MPPSDPRPAPAADLDVLAALLERATPYRWYGCGGGVNNWPVGAQQPDELIEFQSAMVRHEAHAQLLAEAANALPSLLAELRALRRVRDAAAAYLAAVRAEEFADERAGYAESAFRDRDYDEVRARAFHDSFIGHHAASVTAFDARGALDAALSEARRG